MSGAQRSGPPDPLRVGVAIGAAAVATLRFGGRAAGRALDGLIERSVRRALAGPLVEAISRDLVRYAVLDRVTETMLANGIAERTAARIVEGPELERALETVLDSAGTERVVARVIDSRVLDETVRRLLESEQLWLLVDEIARSPAVTDAITKQGIGFADQVAGTVRSRSRSADDWLERAARRALRRRALPDEPAAPGPAPP